MTTTVEWMTIKATTTIRDNGSRPVSSNSPFLCSAHFGAFSRDAPDHR
jgi:hypothetical protein